MEDYSFISISCQSGLIFNFTYIEKSFKGGFLHYVKFIDAGMFMNYLSALKYTIKLSSKTARYQLSYFYHQAKK